MFAAASERGSGPASRRSAEGRLGPLRLTRPRDNFSAPGRPMKGSSGGRHRSLVLRPLADRQPELPAFLLMAPMVTRREPEPGPLERAGGRPSTHVST